MNEALPEGYEIRPDQCGLLLFIYKNGKVLKQAQKADSRHTLPMWFREHTKAEEYAHKHASLNLRYDEEV